MIGAAVYKLGAFLASLFPTGFAEWLTELILKPQYYFRWRSRRNVKRNLRIVLGDAPGDDDIRDLARRTFSNFARSIYYFLRMPSMPADELARRCDSNGLEEIRDQLDKGFVVVGPHLGLWEMGGARIAQMGFSLRTVALPHPSQAVTDFFDRQRRRMGFKSTPLNGSAHALRRAVRHGRGVALLIDRAYGGGGEPAKFFGRDVILPVGHVALAVRARVPVITCACVFTRDGNFKLEWRGPYHPDPGMESRKAMTKLRDICIRDMEEFIRTYPDQWFNFFPFGYEFSAHRR